MTHEQDSLRLEAEWKSRSAIFRRRDILRTISALGLTPLLADVAGAAGGDVSRRTSRSLRIERKFVLFPINNDASPRRVRLLKNGRVLRSFSASLGLPAHWWAHLNVSEWQGQTLELSIEPEAISPVVPGTENLGRGPSETDNGALIASVRMSADIWSPETLYAEPSRPAFHFSSRRGWLNDPNGLMYYNGRYHLFFQHNPYGLRWGNMHWGHAVSTDLVHWRELPIAFYPRGEADLPYSGSAVVDQANTSGWGAGDHPPIVIAFSSTGRGECIVYSQDGGASWNEFEGNPVIKHKGRDPKLLWHEPSSRWVMAVYAERPGSGPNAPARHGIAFYTSSDLKTWTERSWIDGYFECPDLFALPVDDDPRQVKWVLTCAPGYYSIGNFDGERFIPEGQRLPAPAGGNADRQGNPTRVLSAAQVFSNHPQGKHVQIFWGIVEAPGAPFSQMMSFPVELSLRSTVEGVRLCRAPVESVKSLRLRSHDVPPGLVTQSPVLKDLEGRAWDIEAVLRLGTIAPVLMILGGDNYAYQLESQTLTGPNGSMRIPLTDGRLTLRILVDRTTVEVFGDRGQAYGMFIRQKPGPQAPLSLRTTETVPGGDGLAIEKLTVHLLRTAWRNK